ncbi:hypothetical protein [Xenorhabdus sp. KK7.4]|nr:hypothetical protein [Xenorhabdus sp. KK7.4]
MVLILQDLLRIVLLGWTSLEVEVVPGGGIEPPTRGFSIPSKVKKM